MIDLTLMDLKIDWIKNIKVQVLFTLTLITLLLFIGSYNKSKQNAISFVGETLETYPLSHSELTVIYYPEAQIAWMFKFSLPDAYDEDFYIYTSLWGTIIKTTPAHLEELLKKLH